MSTPDSNTGLPIRIPTVTTLLWLDQLLRWVVVYIFDLEKVVNNARSGDGLTWFLLTQLILIPLIIFGLAYARDRRIRRQYRELLQVFPDYQNYRWTVTPGSWSFTLLGVFTIVGALITYVLFGVIFAGASPVAAGQLTLAFTPVFALYFWIIIRRFSLRKPGQQWLGEKIEELEKHSYTEDPQQQIRNFVELELELQSRKQRTDAYIIESTLFGALAFSGFLQITANDLISIADIETFSLQVGEVLRQFVFQRLSVDAETIASLLTKTNLFCLLSIETLICSIFFLIVIAARLLFRAQADRVEFSIQLAKVIEGRKGAEYERQREEEVNRGYQALQNLFSITQFMLYFRSLGVISFFIILISSALFISGFLSLIFIALSLILIAYFKRKALRDLGAKLATWLRTDYQRWARRAFLPLACLGILVAVWLRLNHHSYTVPVAATAFTLLGLVRVLQVGFRPAGDADLPATGGFLLQDEWSTGRLRLILWGFAEFLLYLMLLFNLFLNNEVFGQVFAFSTFCILSVLFFFDLLDQPFPGWKRLLLGVTIIGILVFILLKWVYIAVPDLASWILLGLLVVNWTLIAIRLYPPDRNRNLGLGLLSFVFLFAFFLPRYYQITMRYGLMMPERVSQLKGFEESKWTINPGPEQYQKQFELSGNFVDWMMDRRDISDRAISSALNSEAWHYHLRVPDYWSYKRKALEWAEIAVELDSNILVLDTYASLLADLDYHEKAVSTARYIVAELERIQSSNYSIKANLSEIVLEHGDSIDYALAKTWTDELIRKDSSYTVALLKVRGLARTASWEEIQAYADLLIGQVAEDQRNAVRANLATLLTDLRTDSTTLLFARQLLRQSLGPDSSYITLRRLLLVDSRLGSCEDVAAGIARIANKSRASLGRVSAYSASRLAEVCLNCAPQDPSLHSIGLEWAEHAITIAPENYPYWQTYARLAYLADIPNAREIIKRAIAIGTEYEQPTAELEALLDPEDH